MKKLNVKRFAHMGISMVLALTVAFSNVPAAMTNVYADEISDTKDKQDETNEKKKEAQKKLDELKGKKSNLVSYIKELDAEAKKIEDEIAKLNKEIEDLNSQIIEKQAELKEAKAEERTQYAAMQKRIQFLYEQGEKSYIEVLLTSSSMSQILNRSEYISSISEYDYDMLMQLIDIRKQIADDELQLETDLQALSDKKAKVEEDQEALQVLIDAKNEQLKKTNEDIHDQEQSIEEIEKEQREIAATLKKLEEEARRKAEEAAKKAQQSGGGGGQKANPDDYNVQYTGGSWSWPCDSHTITSRFGYRKAPTAGASTFHKGIDISVSSGSRVYAAKDGVVIATSYDSARGNYVQISHGNGIVTIYEHLSSFNCSVGQSVSKGQTIARSGSTGISTGPHLHFGVYSGGSYVNPLNFY